MQLQALFKGEPCFTVHDSLQEARIEGICVRFVGRLLARESGHEGA